MFMKYTQHSLAANKKIEKDLKLICRKIKENVPDLVSIILTGGFAKGEGSVKLEGGKIFPFNDYDIYFITQNPKKEAEIHQLTKICNTVLGKEGQPFYGFDIFHDFRKKFFVDLHHLPLSKLSQLPPIIRYYELRNHNIILFGKDVSSKIPDYKLKEVCFPSEAIRLVFNRMTNLAQFLRPRFLVNKQTLSNKEALTYYVCRAVLSAAAALLMYKKKPEFTVREVLKTTKESLPKLHPGFARKFPQFLKDLEISTQWKLKPYSVDVDSIELWFRTRDYLGFLAKYFLEDSLNIKVRDWHHFSKMMGTRLPQFFYHPYLKHQIKLRLGIENDLFANLLSFGRKYLNFLYFLRVKKLTGRYWFSILTIYPAPDLQIFSSLPLLLFSINRRGEINRKMLNQAHARLKKLYPLSEKIPQSSSKFWRKFAEDYGNVYISFFWQKLV